MANDPINDFSVALNGIVQTVGTLVQQLVELVNIGINAVGGAIEPLVKTAGQLVEPLVKSTSDLACKVSTTVTPVFQGKPNVTPKA